MPREEAFSIVGGQAFHLGNGQQLKIAAQRRGIRERWGNAFETVTVFQCRHGEVETASKDEPSLIDC